MFQPSQPVTQWTLAIVMVCFLFAWPLHQVEHLGTPPQTALQKISGDLSAQLTFQLNDQEEYGDMELCLWCVIHAQHPPLTGTPLAFRISAESSTPPVLLSTGVPRRHCLLAVSPRGPPDA